MVPSNVLQRTFRIQFGGQVGTCFTLDVDGRQYIVTARHILPQVSGQAAIQIKHDSKWAELVCGVVGAGEGEIDIAVLAPPHVISPSLPLDPTTNAMFLSQDAYFLGFPYGLHAEVGGLNSNFPLPLVKKACVSMFALSGPGPRYLLLDGHNNPGFSGGPVVFAVNGQGAATNVAGVVSGYKYVWDKVFVGEQETELAVKYNTGIVVVYAIDHAIALIRENPIGAEIAGAVA
jgi:hypothetical protein